MGVDASLLSPAFIGLVLSLASGAADEASQNL